MEAACLQTCWVTISADCTLYISSLLRGGGRLKGAQRHSAVLMCLGNYNPAACPDEHNCRNTIEQVRAALEMDGGDIPGLAFQGGLSMEWLTGLCCTPVFYHRCARLGPTRAQ
jgi:hypothetical protein